MKRILLICATALLVGCNTAEEASEPVDTQEVSATTVEQEPEADVKEEESKKAEPKVVRYSEEEINEFQFAMLTASEQATEYLSNTRADIYICGKICDDQPLTDIQLSMDVSRSGLQRSADALLNLVPQIREVASSGSEGVDAIEMARVADQFEKTGNDINNFLGKQDWTSWDEPGEMIQVMIDEIEVYLPAYQIESVQDFTN